MLDDLVFTRFLTAAIKPFQPLIPNLAKITEFINLAQIGIRDEQCIAHDLDWRTHHRSSLGRISDVFKEVSARHGAFAFGIFRPDIHGAVDSPDDCAPSSNEG